MNDRSWRSDWLWNAGGAVSVAWAEKGSNVKTRFGKACRGLVER